MKFECKKCGVCCKNAPCLLYPIDLLNLSLHFQISFEELFIKCLVITKYTCEPNMFVVYPKRKGDTQILMEENWNISENTCIFFDDASNLCIINQIKPYGGKMLHCDIEKPNRSPPHNFDYIFRRAVILWYSFFNKVTVEKLNI